MLYLSMRRSIAAVAAAVSLALLALTFAPADAAAPMAKKSGPGYYRMMLGDFEVTALSDGTTDLPVNTMLNGIAPADIDKVLAGQALKSPLETSFNAYLINTGAKLILIDSGYGTYQGPTLGRMLENLKASGYAPEQVDEVYITHMHPDHVGGLMNGSQRVFPNAVVRADKADQDLWLSAEQLEKAPAARQRNFKIAQESLNPYVAAGKFSAFEGNTTLGNGISSILTGGHTPGHSMFAVESKGQKMIVLGDLMHVAAVQFAQPAVGISFDINSKVSAAARARLYDEAAKGLTILAASHISFPGLGRVRTDGAGYVWLPVNYSVTR